MFDIGSPELLVVLLIAVLVMGPDRLPEAIRTCATWWGRCRARFGRLKQQIEDEIGFAQIRQQLHEEQMVQEIKAARIELNGLAGNAGFSNGGGSGLQELRKPDRASTNPADWPGMPPPGANQ